MTFIEWLMFGAACVVVVVLAVAWAQANREDDFWK